MRVSSIGYALLLALVPLSIRAQSTGQITGVVRSDLGQPLSGVQVTVRGTRLTSLTAENGRYLIANVPAGQHVLETARLGFGAREIPVTVSAGTPLVLDIQLQTRAIALDQVVVIGYGTQRREEITGAVASVSSDKFVQGPARDAGSLIAGKIAGLAVTTPSGDPTDRTQIILRGRTTLQGPTQPLVLVDGVPGSLATVAAQDIESISVLKDGSAAAVYGSRASNGVILVTTKRHAGGAPTLRYDGYVSQQKLYRSPDFLTASDTRRLIKEGVKFPDLGYDTNWLDEVLREPVSSRHSLSLSGGATNTNYSVSLNLENTEGIFNRSDNREVNGRANVRHTMFNGRLEAEANLSNRTQKFFSGPDFEWAWQMAISRNPTDRVKDENGNWVETATGALRYQNPVSLIEEENGETESRVQRMHGTLTLRPIDRLRFSVLGGTTRGNSLSGSATTFRHQSHTQGNSGGSASRSTNASDERIIELTGTYADRIRDHNFTVLGGYGYQDFMIENFNAGNSRFPTDLFGFDQLQRGSGLSEGLATVASGRQDYKVMGYFGRLNYDWKNRYLLMGSLRYEADSRFGADHKTGLFPAVSAGWRVSEEGFMDGLGFVDDLRLRAGYGVTGIAPGTPYLSLTSYGYGQRVFFNGQWVQSLAPNRNPNPNLRWEEKRELNVGANFSLFDFRLNGALDVYQRDTKDMLYNYSVPVPPNLFGSILANVGHMRNKGIEVELSYDLIKRAGFQWTTSANWSTNSNKLLSLSNDVYQANDFFYSGSTAAPIQQSTHRVQVGQPIGNFYGFKSVDIDSAGRWIVLNKDGERISIRNVTEADRHVLGNGLPKHFFAWNNTAEIGSFDLSLNLRGAADFQILNFLRMYYENPTQVNYNMLESAFDPVYGKRTVNYDLAYVSYYVEDGDYVKLDNATLGYTFGEGKLGRLSGVLANARAYVSGRNLLTITGYKGLDPEVSVSGLSPGNDDRASYPTTRIFTFGMTFSF